MTVTIRTGDCRDILRELPDESVHCVVTSPPYWGLRDYGVVGQLGMEASLGEYVDVMVEVFRQVRRVLRKDGTLWLNLGDSYAASPNGRSAADTKAAGKDDRTFRDKPFSTIGEIYRWDRKSERNGHNLGSHGAMYPNTRPGPGDILKPKDLCGIPWRVAFALQADGWWLRQDIIWSKPNPMPESVTDRCTKAHEYLFLLTKSERYYYDAEAIAEAATPGTHITTAKSFGTQAAGLGVIPTGNQIVGKQWEWGATRNRRSVWEVATQPFSEAHFATFPPALIEPCIKAGCPVGGTVLDPFGGAGTTGLVADRLQRNAILIELNPTYADMSQRRITDDAPLFTQVNDYDATDDFARSIDEAYRVIRERKANGGPGWTPP